MLSLISELMPLSIPGVVAPPSIHPCSRIRRRRIYGNYTDGFPLAVYSMHRVNG
jgi:hypothetical protein